MKSSNYLHPANTSERKNSGNSSFLPKRRRDWPPKIFCPHPAVFNWDGSALSHGGQIAELFYKECYDRPEIVNGPYPGSSFRAVLRSAKFLEEVIGDAGKQKNVFSYLVGEVGVGKSAYINYVLTQHGRDLFYDANVWFLRVDLERTYSLEGKQRMTRGTILIKVVSKLLELFERFPLLGDENPLIRQSLSELRKCWHEAISNYLSGKTEEKMTFQRNLNDSMSSASSRGADDFQALWYSAPLETAFASFIKLYKNTTSRTLLLILDNVDVVIHQDDREIFTEDGKRSAAQNIQGLLAFLKQFVFAQGPLDALSTSILTVMREDTYEILNLARGISFQTIPDINMDKAFSFKEIEWLKVFESRMQLAEKISSVLTLHQGSQKEIQGLVARMRETFQGGTPIHRTHQNELVNALKDISSFGNRGMVSYFSHSAELHPQHAGSGKDRLELAARYRTTALIAFFLRSNQWFSQEASQFPNLYLVNVPSGSCRDHRPSFWLKRLILEMIRQSGEVRVQPHVVLDTFSGYEASGRAQQGYYERMLVETALASMADVQRSNVLGVDWNCAPPQSDGLSVYPKNVRLRKRALRCFREVFDTFTYLQVIIDDEFLLFPASVVGQFVWRTGDPTYEYFNAENPADFTDNAKKMILYKGRRVLLFLVIIEEALAIEAQAFHEVFKNLEQRNIHLPNVQKIRLSVLRHLGNLHKHFGLDVDLRRCVADAEVSRDAIRKDLQQAIIHGK